MLRSGRIFETYSGRNRCETLRRFNGDSLSLKRNELSIASDEPAPVDEPEVEIIDCNDEANTLLRQIRLLLIALLILKVICLISKK